MSQVLLVDSTLTLRARRVTFTNPEEYDGHLFLDETGGPIVLDAAGLEEVVSALLADASGARTDEFLTDSSQPAQQSSAVLERRRKYQQLLSPQTIPFRNR